jgi:hypothetical protein
VHVYLFGTVQVRPANVFVNRIFIFLLRLLTVTLSPLAGPSCSYMARVLLCLTAVLFTFAVTASAARELEAQPAINIKWPGGGLTGGDNGQPLRVQWRGGSTVIGNTVDACGKEGVGVAVEHRGKTYINTLAGAGCKPATVNVKAGGSSTTVVAGAAAAEQKTVPATSG